MLALRHNPYWHLQPRVLGGDPDAGQWTLSGPLTSGAASLLPILQRAGIAAVHAFRDVARRVAPMLRRLPRRWDDDVPLPTEEDFDVETRRIGPPSWNRFGHPNLRFRSERGLREYLGPAGAGREWHHIVEKRLAENGRFSPEQIHNTDNIISLPVNVHRRINAIMSGKDGRSDGAVLRRWMERFSFGEQYNFGLDIVEEASRELGYEVHN